MPAELVKNEKGEYALWDGKQLQPIQGQVVKNEAGEFGVWDGKTINPIPDLVSEKPIVAPVTGNPPRFPTAERVIEEAAVPALTAAAGFIPGGLAVQSAIGAGGEALNQVAQGEDIDLKKIGVAASVPAAARGLMNAGRSVARSMVNQSGRPQMVEAAVSKVKGWMGVGDKATEALEAAKNIQTPITSFASTEKKIYEIIGRESKLPGGSTAAKELAEDVMEKLTKPGQTFTYGEIMESTTALREAAEAAGDNRTKRLLYEMRDSLLDDITKVDPAAREAFKLYRRQEAVNTVAKKFRSAGDRLSKLKDLLDEDSLVAGAFSDKEKKTLETIASHIGTEGFLKIAGSLGMLGAAGYQAGDMSGAGAAAAIPAIIGALVSHPGGRYLARGLIGPNGAVNKAAIPALAQFMRGYNAQQATPQPDQPKRPATLQEYREQAQ